MAKINWEIVESFGTPELIERLTNEAIGIAGCTGSVGAMCMESNTDGETIALVEVKRVIETKPRNDQADFMALMGAFGGRR
jgi:hypothetical protein